MKVSDPRKLETAAELAELVNHLRKFRKKASFKPYAKQVEFFYMGDRYRERLLMAGNQLGKTEAGAFETACHLTGEYPDWWAGKRFDEAVNWWAAGVTGAIVRDAQQAKLCGPPGVIADFGSGLIPREAFAQPPSTSRGTPDAYDTIYVKHKSGGISTLTFKSYESGRGKFQAVTLDGIWLDEEPPLDIYGECLARIAATNGILYMTFTPLMGMTKIVEDFLSGRSKDRGVVTMTIEDAEHIPKEMRARIIEGYPAHERDARVKGIPMMGSGRVFPYSDDAVIEGSFDLPKHWPLIWGVDFGIGHPFAAVLAAWDRDLDVIHILNGFKMSDSLPLVHAKRMKAICASAPVAWPHDGNQREKSSGKTLASVYKQEGLSMLGSHSTFPDGGMSPEAAILEMSSRFNEGRLKVAYHLTDWLNEFQMYHRKDGLIVKTNDDLLDATMKVIMMKRMARICPLGAGYGKRDRQKVAHDVDFDVS